MTFHDIDVVAATRTAIGTCGDPLIDVPLTRFCRNGGARLSKAGWSADDQKASE